MGFFGSMGNDNKPLTGLLILLSASVLGAIAYVLNRKLKIVTKKGISRPVVKSIQFAAQIISPNPQKRVRRSRSKKNTEPDLV